METREIIISIYQLNLIKKLIDSSDLSKFNYEESEELNLISGMIEDCIEEKEDVSHGFCY